MPRGVYSRKNKETPVTTMNAAPGYAAPAPMPAPATPYSAPPPSPVVDAYTGYASPPGAFPTPTNGNYANGPVAMGAPPPREPQNPFVNAEMLWKFGRPVRATILGMRDATGTGKKEFASERGARKAWFLDLKLEDGTKANGRINEGDMRHQKLWAAYQGQCVGHSITLRLSNPGDIDPFTKKQTKAPWMIDCN